MILCRLLMSPEHRYTWNFALGWNFQFQPGLKKICFTREFQPGAIRISFTFISPWGENIFAKICGIFYKKCFTEKKHVSTTTMYPKCIHHHSPPAKIYLPSSITNHRQPKYIYHHPPQSKIYPSKKVFYEKNIKKFYSEINDEKHLD